MTISTEKNLPQERPFDTQTALDALRAFRAPQDRLRGMSRRGEVVRVKKGLYVPGWRDGENMPVDPLVLASLIYGPSYVSLATALSIHGLIPERVTEITSVTTKRKKTFETPLGRYSYAPVSAKVFSLGVTLAERPGGRFFLANAEKALCDQVAQLPGITTQKALAQVVLEDFRIEEGALKNLDENLITHIATKYRRENVRAFSAWFHKFQKRSRS